MSGIRSYGRIWNLGHPSVEELFRDPVIVEEKVDGSQFSFANIDGELVCRSKGAQVQVDAPQALFSDGVETAKELFSLLRPGWVYRGEYLKKKRHNGLDYDRIPDKHFILFDIDTGEQRFLTHTEKREEGARLGLETVPLLFEGEIRQAKDVMHLMESTSVLGGQTIEGLVFKNYKRFGVDGKALMGKHVSEAFKEVQRGHWKKDNPAGKAILGQLAERYCTPARWDKALIHMRERGEITNSPKDIGPLMKEVQLDVEAECAEEIRSDLYAWARKHVLRKAAAGVPGWYKQQLIEHQFEQEFEGEAEAAE